MYKLLQGDCLELMNKIPDKSIDMILCDLPYGTTKNKWDSVLPFDKMWEQYDRIIKAFLKTLYVLGMLKMYWVFSNANALY